MSMVESLDPAARRAVKSAGAFRTISEVAEELDVPQHVLRFWESKFTQVRPLKRGGGRRYYRPEDVLLLRRIRQCLYQDGYTIKGVQRLLREGALKNMPVVEPVPEAPEPVAASPARAAEPPAPAKPVPARADPDTPPPGYPTPAAPSSGLHAECDPARQPPVPRTAAVLRVARRG